MKDIDASSPDGRRFLVKVLGRFTCPFCDHGKTFVLGYMNGEEIPCVLHDDVPCDDFSKLGLIEYMRAARRAGARCVEEPN